LLSVSAHSAYPRSTPGPRVRVVEFIDPLREHGITLRFEAALSEDDYATVTNQGSSIKKAQILGKAAIRLRRADAAGGLKLIHRLGFLTPVPGIEPPRRLDLYDFDDALYLGSIGAANRRARFVKREDARWRAMIKRARAVVAGNAHLASMAAGGGAQRVEVIPSCVDPGAYRLHSHRAAEVVTAGWIGSPSTSPYLREVLSALEQVNRAGTKVRLVIVGGHIDHDAPWLETRPWRLDRVADDLDEFDFGLMPMPDDEWTRGKCGYKLLQYFAAGLPAVASPVGVATDLIGADRGFTASNPDEWVQAMNVLAGDPEGRTEMGANGRRLVERKFSYDRWAPELAALMKELA
jgi:glycosyltransferase involved in cell wall biosynthesis